MKLKTKHKEGGLALLNSWAEQPSTSVFVRVGKGVWAQKKSLPKFACEICEWHHWTVDSNQNQSALRILCM